MRMDLANRALHIKQHWFFPAALLVLSINCFVALTDSWSAPRLIEAGLLFDLALLIPALYWWCYRRKGKTAAIRALALGCLGIWIASYLVPQQHQELLGALSVLRYVGLTVLLVIEVRLIVMIYRAAFSAKPEAGNALDQALKAADMPPWVQRIMKWELTIWQKVFAAVWRWFKR